MYRARLKNLHPHYICWTIAPDTPWNIPYFLAKRPLLSIVSMSTSEVPSPSWQISGSLWVSTGHASWKPLHVNIVNIGGVYSGHYLVDGRTVLLIILFLQVSFILQGPSWEGNHSVVFLLEGVTHNQKTEIWLLEKE